MGPVQEPVAREIFGSSGLRMNKRSEPNVKQRHLSFKPSIQDRCERFLAKNPGFYDEYVRRARMLKARGWESFSSDCILHSMRFDRALRVNRDGLYKINDQFSSRLSRLVQEREPDLTGFFETRRLRTP